MKNLIYILFLFPLGIQAQQLTLKDAINTALANNLEIQIAKNNTEISKLNNSYGVAGGLPSLGINATDNNSVYDLNQKLSNGTEINKSNVFSNTLNAGITANIVLFNGFKVVATKERLELIQQQSEIQLNQQIQNIIASVMISYYEIYRQQMYLKIIQNNVDVSNKKLEILQERYQVGMANDADLLQAKIDVNIAEQDYKNQLLIIEEGKTNLLRIMGVKQLINPLIQDSISMEKILQKDSIFNFITINPLYRSAEHQVKINQQLVKEIGAQRYPLLRASTGYNFTYSNSTAGFNLFTQNYGPFIGASLQIPIYNGSIYKTQVDVAKLNVMNAQLQQESLLLNLKAEAEIVWKSYENALSQLQAQQENYENAQKLIDLMLQKFKYNQATILELKAAQTTFENAAYKMVNVQFSAKIAEIELKKMVFELGE